MMACEKELFDWQVKRGSLMASKRAYELTQEERDFLYGPPPAGWVLNKETCEYERLDQEGSE